MRGSIVILLLFFSCFSHDGLGQLHDATIEEPINNSIDLFLIPQKTVSVSQNKLSFSQTFDGIVSKLERIRKKKKSDIKFLRSIFYRVHTNSLIKYKEQATMDETLRNGRFGCLTGTALYALILEHFGYDYEIIELPNHVFLKVNTENKSIILESTLPNDGFITFSKELNRVMEQEGFDPRNIRTLSTVGDDSVDEWNLVEGHNKITIKQLAGLQYFNESVRFYVQKDYLKSMDMIKEAYRLYPSKRNERLMQLVINKILKYGEIKEEIKNKYLQQYIKVVKRQKISKTK